MPSKRTEDRTAVCSHCRSVFTYRASLPRQTLCMECYYAHSGDFTGAVEELAWKLGVEHGSALREADTQQAEAIAKMIELIPLRDVIALCHPDRHPVERADQANAATAALLDLQRSLRELEQRHAA